MSPHPQSCAGLPLQAPPGLQSPQALPSLGSVMHVSGQCRPCAWFAKPQGCLNGRECRHCHSCLPGELKKRKKVKQDLKHMIGKKGDEGVLTSNSYVGLQEDIVPPLCRFPPWVMPLEAPRIPPLALPSVGSVLHGVGTCKPCAWHWKPRGCQNGFECKHCHVCQSGEIQRRKMKKQHPLRTDIMLPASMCPDVESSCYIMNMASFLGVAGLAQTSYSYEAIQRHRAAEMFLGLSLLSHAQSLALGARR